MIILRDSFVNTIVGGKLDALDDPAAPTAEPSIESLVDWQGYLRQRFELRPRDVAVVIPIKGEGPNVEAEWAQWPDADKELWRAQMAFNCGAIHDYLRGLDLRARGQSELWVRDTHLDTLVCAPMTAVARHKTSRRHPPLRPA